MKVTVTLCTRVIAAAFLLMLATTIKAQVADSTAVTATTDTVRTDATDAVPNDSLTKKLAVGAKGDKRSKIKGQKNDSIASGRDWKTWRPDPKRALWLAVVLPGAGQIYNRKYWKLPIVYGGFVGCIYAMQWNNQMYHDYSQAYIDLVDNDPSTQSYNQFLHLGTEINSRNAERYKSLFKKRKDYYRRYRDLSFFILVGVYGLSIIDAYVDASLSEFDISDDLSLRVEPTVISDKQHNNPLRSSALGIRCALTF